MAKKVTRKKFKGMTAWIVVDKDGKVPIEERDFTNMPYFWLNKQQAIRNKSLAHNHVVHVKIEEV